MHNPDRLRKNLVVEFIGEDGIDAAALKYDFLEVVMRRLISEMFETTEDPYSRIPRAEWGNQREFEIAGIIVAYSILQGGPGLGCLPPVLYALVISGSSDCLLDEFPVLNNVPRSAATFDLIELCEKV